MPDLINGDAERPEHASRPFPKIDPNKLWMIILVDAIDHWLLFRAFERGQIINNCADILGSYRGLVVVDHLVVIRLFVAARTDASSSMTEITESVDKTVLPDAGTERLP